MCNTDGNTLADKSTDEDWRFDDLADLSGLSYRFRYLTMEAEDPSSLKPPVKAFIENLTPPGSAPLSGCRMASE
ncbi:unnamed protein product [Merluccius merluccius]